MSRFCGACGAALPEGAGFCGACGAGAQQAASPAAPPAFQPLAQPVPAASAGYASAGPASPGPASPASASPASATAVPVAQSSNTWVKVVLVVVAIIFVGGAIAVAGVIYVAHKVSQKAHAYAHQVLDQMPSATPAVAAGDRAAGASASQADSTPSGPPSGFTGDACRLLSKADVSRAIGVEVVETRATDGGCSYLAKGTSVDMVAKHTAAMVGAKGADKKSQAMIEQFAGLVGNSMPAKEKSDLDNGDGSTVVLAFGIDTNEAEEQMKLNAKGLSFGGMGSIDAIDGIGDEAFSKADSMMFVRKGDKLIRIMYSSCPCGTAAIRPLAKQIVANL
jgi:hypothetical protein